MTDGMSLHKAGDSFYVLYDSIHNRVLSTELVAEATADHLAPWIENTIRDFQAQLGGLIGDHATNNLATAGLLKSLPSFQTCCFHYNQNMGMDLKILDGIFEEHFHTFFTKFMESLQAMTLPLLATPHPNDATKQILTPCLEAGRYLTHIKTELFGTFVGVQGEQIAQSLAQYMTSIQKIAEDTSILGEIAWDRLCHQLRTFLQDLQPLKQRLHNLVAFFNHIREFFYRPHHSRASAERDFEQLMEHAYPAYKAWLDHVEIGLKTKYGGRWTKNGPLAKSFNPRQPAPFKLPAIVLTSDSSEEMILCEWYRQYTTHRATLFAYLEFLIPVKNIVPLEALFERVQRFFRKKSGRYQAADQIRIHGGSIARVIVNKLQAPSHKIPVLVIQGILNDCRIKDRKEAVYFYDALRYELYQKWNVEKNWPKELDPTPIITMTKKLPVPSSDLKSVASEVN
jgi:hypothetical protein